MMLNFDALTLFSSVLIIQISFWIVSDNVYSSHSYDSPKKDKKKLNKVQEKKPTIKEEDLTSEGMHHNILWYLNLDIHSDWP